MRTATATPVAYTVTCPACREVVCDPATGSHILTASSVEMFARRDGAGKASCWACGVVFKLPASLKLMLA